MWGSPRTAAASDSPRTAAARRHPHTAARAPGLGRLPTAIRIRRARTLRIGVPGVEVRRRGRRSPDVVRRRSGRPPTGSVRRSVRCLRGVRSQSRTRCLRGTGRRPDTTWRLRATRRRPDTTRRLPSTRRPPEAARRRTQLPRSGAHPGRSTPPRQYPEPPCLPPPASQASPPAPAPPTPVPCHHLRRRPPHRVLDQQPVQYRRQFARPDRRCRVLAAQGRQCREVPVAVEGAAALHGGVQRGAEREQVGGRGGRFATHAFGARQPGAEDARGGREPGLAGLGLESDAVVGEQHARVGVTRSVRRQKDVGRFHIPVEDADPVPGGQRVEHGEPDAGRLSGRQRSRTPHDRLEIHRVRPVLHDDPRQPLVHQHVVHRRHMRVPAQPGRVPGLAAGPGDPLRGLARVHRHVRQRRNLLHRDVAGQLLVVCEPHAAHTARAGRPPQPVPPVDDPAFAVLRRLPRHHASPRDPRGSAPPPRTRRVCLSKVASHLPLTGGLFGANHARPGTRDPHTSGGLRGAGRFGDSEARPGSARSGVPRPSPRITSRARMTHFRYRPGGIPVR